MRLDENSSDNSDDSNDEMSEEDLQAAREEYRRSLNHGGRKSKRQKRQEKGEPFENNITINYVYKYCPHEDIEFLQLLIVNIYLYFLLLVYFFNLPPVLLSKSSMLLRKTLNSLVENAESVGSAVIGLES